MIEAAKVKKIIESLEFLAKRPAMYFGADDDPEFAKRYLFGVRFAVNLLLDLEPHSMISRWHSAIEASGYRVTARGPDREMEEKGMAKQEIVLELIKIELTIYRTLLDEIS